MTRASKTAGQHSQSARRALIAAIVEARTATGLSQREFAKKLGRANNYVQKIEAGKRHVNVLDFIEIARAAGIPADELIRWVTRTKG